MGSAMGIGLALGGLGLFSGLSGAERARNGQLASAAQAEATANALRAQGDVDKAQAEREAYEIDRRKARLRREFEETMGRNRSMLGAGNVDMSSGSALDVAEGNIERFAQDMGDNAYERALKIWEGNYKRDMAGYRADSMEANASYLKSSAGNLGTSILTGVIQGVGGFASGYSMAGGKLGSLFGSKAAQASKWATMGRGFSNSMINSIVARMP